jgi:transposase-like protein
MTTREIQGHIEEIYGFEASPGLISAITEAVMEFKPVRAADQTVRGTV